VEVLVAKRSAKSFQNQAPLFVLATLLLVSTLFSMNFMEMWRNHQHLNYLRAEVASLQHQQALIAQQEKFLSSRQALLDLAREQYQLVEQNAQLVQVLPSTSNRSYAGDPANDPIVSPASAVNALALSQPTHQGFWHRVLSTLEFWR
jgi:hypothetical protein